MEAAAQLSIHNSLHSDRVPRNNGVTVAIVCTSRLLGESLRRFLHNKEGLSVAAVATDCDRLLAIGPDVILVQHDHASSTSIRNVAVALPAAKLVVIDAVPAELDVVGCLKYAVAGFTLRDTVVEELVAVIHAVAEGDRVLPQTVTDRLCIQLSEIGKKSNRDLWMSIDELTLRERQVVQFISDGLSNKEIAAQMNISMCTVKSHVHSILEKLHVSSRIDVINYLSRRHRSATRFVD
jgi:DNA-binding NarL/FixJ family response regulator